MSKRIFDIVIATLGLILLSPLLISIAIVLKICSPGPVLFRGLRVGQGGRIFRILKFRTMVENAIEAGPGITAFDDLRITDMGRVLRKSKLDELPQLWNVLKGEMSLVGPRPEDPRYVALYDEKQREILQVRPGITSPASVKYRKEEIILRSADLDAYAAFLMPEKLRVDLEYCRSRTFMGDLLIFVQSVWVVFCPGSRGTGSKQRKESVD